MGKRGKKRPNYYKAHPNKGPAYVSAPRGLYRLLKGLDRVCYVAGKSIAAKEALIVSLKGLVEKIRNIY